MKFKIIVATILVLFSIMPLLAQDTIMHLTLKQSCQLGIDKNVNVLNAELEQQKTNYQYKEAKSKLYPQVEAFSSLSYYYAIPKMVLPGEIIGETGMVAVEIGTKYDWSNGFRVLQVLYSQSYLTSLKLTQQMIVLSGLTIQQKKEDLIYQISQLYYLCQVTRMQIEQLNEIIQNANKLLEIAKLQNENGFIRKIDYSRVLVNKGNVQSQIDNLELLHNQQLGLLKYLIGLNIEDKVELSDSLYFSSNNISSILPNTNTRVELQLLDKHVEVASLNLKLNRQMYLPTLSGFGQYYYQGQRNEFDFFKGGNDKFFNVGLFGLSLNIPIFDGFEKQAKIKQKNIELMQLQNTRKSTSDYFSKELSDALKNYDNGKKALIRQQENIKVAEEIYDISLQSYSQQIMSLSDLLLSESILIEARLSYFNALMQLKNAELDVKKSKGELLNL